MTVVCITLSYTSCVDTTSTGFFLIFVSLSSFILAFPLGRRDDTQRNMEQTRLTSAVDVSQLCQVLVTKVWAANFLLPDFTGQLYLVLFKQEKMAFKFCIFLWSEKCILSFALWWQWEFWLLCALLKRSYNFV